MSLPPAAAPGAAGAACSARPSHHAARLTAIAPPNAPLVISVVVAARPLLTRCARRQRPHAGSRRASRAPHRLRRPLQPRRVHLAGLAPCCCVVAPRRLPATRVPVWLWLSGRGSPLPRSSRAFAIFRIESRDRASSPRGGSDGGVRWRRVTPHKDGHGGVSLLWCIRSSIFPHLPGTRMEPQ